MSDAYTTPPAKTTEDIERVVSFIRARVTPLRDKFPYDSDEGKAHQALLDMASMIKGSAASEVERGESPEMPHLYLTAAARQWDDHPDFLAKWND